MPNGGGLALFNSIGQRHQDVLERFVFISGDILNPQLHSLSDSSQVPLLSKPFDAAKLDNVLDLISSRRFGKREAVVAHLQ
jgi:hypothetical protein